ncbi:MAG: DUF192 domain-containing protein [Myxococcales bacterium]|nr:DUF192 domain-containing protein [Myxococcales bacterium]
MLALLGACGETPRAELVDPAAPVRVRFATPTGDAVVTVEVADTRSTIEKGLSGRTSLAPDAGMLFFMGKEQDHRFWMKDTLIPLDMIWLSKDKKIVGIQHNAQPRTETSRSAGKRSLYVLEVNGGWCKAHGVHPDARVTFENVK